MRSMRSGVSDSDTSVAIRSPARRSVLSRSASPIAATLADQHPARAGRRVVELAAPRDDVEDRGLDARRVAAGGRAGGSVKLAASTLSASTSTRISLSHGVIVLSIRAAGCGSTPAGSRTRWVP